MKLETFFERFDLFADAPGAATKMRELILQLAFSGGLSGKRLANSGTPHGWKIHTIESIALDITSGFPCSRDHQVSGGHVHLRTHNITTRGPLNFDLLVQIDPRMVDPKKSSIRAGDILFNNTNSQDLVGKTSLVDRDYNYGFSNHITRIRLKKDVLPGFVAFYLSLLRNSGYFAKICTRWINQAAVNTDTLKKQAIPLPPLAEQKRLVAKVDELMALCDQLEAQQQERETRHAALARAALTHFAEAPTPASLDFIFNKSYHIDPADLRKSILTLAVQGKLVQQNPRDEPAESLIERIAIVRGQLSPGRREKVAKKIREFDESKCTHGIPSTWTWCRLGELVLDFRYGTSRKCDRNEGGVPVLRIPNIQGGRIDSTDLKFTAMPPAEFEELRLKEGDLLLVRSNGSESLVGRSAVISAEDDRFAYAGYLVRARLPVDDIFPPFLHIALSSPSVRDQIEGPIRTTSGVKNLNTTELSNLTLPLPPLAEQHRIVAKVDQLMTLVSQLEAQLAASHAAAAKILEALVVELTSKA